MNILRAGQGHLPEQASFDVVVLGAGGAGMATALCLAQAGQQVLLLESTACVGGTTALSAGTAWIPLSTHGAQVNPADTREAVETYLDAAVGDAAPRAMRQAFLDAGAAAVDFYERETELRFRPYPRHPDYLSELPGSTLCGRAIEPLPFDGRLLGEDFDLVRPPIPEFTVLGGMMVDRTDINHLLGMGRSLASARHAARILARHARDRLGYPRGTRLVMGNALVARLLHSLKSQPNVTLALGTELQTMARGQGSEHELVVRRGHAISRVTARKALVLASGGFNRHPALRQALLPGVSPDWCPGAPGHAGVAQSQAREALGAAWGRQDGQPPSTHAFWAPVSLRRRADGSQAVFPHFVMDRAKPGMITVDQRGERFLNESTSYHRFGLAMQTAQAGGQAAIPAFLVADAAALARYGMGMVRPGGKGLAPFLADGYLVRGESLADLARQLDMNAEALSATVARFNAMAARGVDEDFQRGTTAYQHNIGDATLGLPNPNLGPLTQAPYYALRLYPGDIGACSGLVTDGDGRVQGPDGQPLPGLYALGNDAQSIMGDRYTAPGITIGPALVFAYRAARAIHAPAP